MTTRSKRNILEISSAEPYSKKILRSLSASKIPLTPHSMTRRSYAPNLKILHKTPVDSTIMFDDDSDMKLLLLSIFAHDPCHDFSGERIKTDDIFVILQKMYNNLNTENAEPTLRKYIKTVFIPEFTNIIVSGGIGKAMDKVVAYTKKQIMPQETNDVKNDIQKMIYDSIQNRLNTPAIKKLKGYSKYKGVLLHKLYKITHGGSAGTTLPPTVFSSLNTNSLNLEPGPINTKSTTNEPKAITEVDYDKFFEELPDAIDGAETEFEKYLYEEIQNHVEPSKIFNIYTETSTDTLDSNQSGGTPESLTDFAYNTNKKTLTEIVRWVLLYLDCAVETDGILLPKFVGIPNTGNPKSLAKHYILNVQILILYNFYVLYHDTEYAKIHTYQKTLSFIIDKIPSINFESYCSSHLFQANNIQSNWLSANIDESIKNASEIIINKMFPNNILYNKQNEINKLYDFVSYPMKSRFVINNASNMNIVNKTKDNIYCPVTSIIDPMYGCPYSKITKHTIYKTRLHITNAVKSYTYFVDITPNTKYTEKPTVHIKGKVTVQGEEPIIIDKDISMSRLHRPELSVGMVYKDMLKNMSEILKKSTIDISNFREFIQNITKDIIEGLCVKSIGDWGQEVTSISRFGAYAENRLDKLTLIMDGANVIPYDKSGQAKRLGVAGDRPSAFRMIYMCLFANPNYINRQAAVGYMTRNQSNDFIVYTPLIKSDITPTPKRKRGGTKRKHNLKKSRTRKLKRKRMVSLRNTPISL